MTEIFSFLLALNPGVLSLVLISVLIIILVTRPKIDWANKKIIFNSSKVKRSCLDCIRYLRSVQVGYEVRYYTLSTSILRDQMTFAEHKLQAIELLTTNKLNWTVHTEIKRSFKENNFCHLDDISFNNYINNQIENLKPLIGYTDNLRIDKLLEEVYKNAKQVKNHVDEQLKVLEDNLTKTINDYLEVKENG